MSCLIAVRDLASNTVHILTDAASTYMKDAIVARIHCKQVITRAGVAVGGYGPGPALRQARR
jgi:hypothetical protein